MIIGHIIHINLVN